MNTNVWILKNFNYIENEQSLSYGEFFSSWKGFGFVDELVAAKVIHQHMLFFT